MATVNFELDDQLYDKAKEAAAKIGIPFAGLVRLLLANHFNEIQFSGNPKEDHTEAAKKTA
jgi:antitoxin component of RelBE/YafQ-DinJ toxin-antitoxin module